MIWIWLGFLALVCALLAVDLGIFHRRAHVVRMTEALIWSGVWIACALLFAVVVYFGYEQHWLGLGTGAATEINGRSAALKYLTGYVVEKSLSVDNIFVMAVIFAALSIPAMFQHRVLFWGIVGALILRGVMIAVGSQLIARYHWVLYVFGVFLIITAAKLLLLPHRHPCNAEMDDAARTKDNWAIRLARRWLPVTPELHGQRLLVNRDGRWWFTPLAVALVVVELTDIAFAVDSIPAIFAITDDPFLVFTSNVFAMLGLRSLYFALAGMIARFHYLSVSLAVILAGVGVKMLAGQRLAALIGPSFDLWVLGWICLVLTIGVVASLIKTASPVARSSRRQAASSSLSSVSITPIERAMSNE
jgi:tellurite resistance protein TerC